MFKKIQNGHIIRSFVDGKVDDAIKSMYTLQGRGHNRTTYINICDSSM